MLIIVKRIIRKNPQTYPNPTIGRTPTARFPFDIVFFLFYMLLADDYPRLMKDTPVYCR